jgi:hypothetical protein
MDEEERKSRSLASPGMTGDEDAAVARAAMRLREEVPVRAAWREDLLTRVDAMGAPGPLTARGSSDDAEGRWTVRPWVAMAASVALVSGGTALGVVLAGSTVPAGERPGATPVAAVGARPAVVRVMYVAAGARQVSIVGDFNGWDPAASPLRRLADGRTWIAELPLAPGRYTYSFYVDGTLAADPTAPRSPDDDFDRGGERASSVLMVRGS